MTRQRHSRGERAAAFALLVAVPVAVAAAIGLPLAEAHRALDEDIAGLTDRIARYERLIAARPELEAERAALAERERDDPGLLRGASDALAAADMQEGIAAVIEFSGARLESVQILPGVDEHGLRRIGLRIQMAARLTELVDIVAALEDGKPHLFLDSMVVAARDRRLGEVPADADAPLAVRVDVVGYAAAQKDSGK